MPSGVHAMTAALHKAVDTVPAGRAVSTAAAASEAAAEVFGEAGPTAFLQMYVLLLAAHPSYFQYVSIMISIE